MNGKIRTGPSFKTLLTKLQRDPPEYDEPPGENAAASPQMPFSFLPDQVGEGVPADQAVRGYQVNGTIAAGQSHDDRSIEEIVAEELSRLPPGSIADIQLLRRKLARRFHPDATSSAAAAASDSMAIANRLIDEALRLARRASD